MSIRRIAGFLALLYALLVLVMQLSDLRGEVVTVVYVGAALLAPVAVLLGDDRARRGDTRADAMAQAGLGLIVGIWFLPASSGLIAILALIAAVMSAARSVHRRGIALLAFATGAAAGFGLLILSLRPA